MCLVISHTVIMMLMYFMIWYLVGSKYAHLFNKRRMEQEGDDATSEVSITLIRNPT